MLGTYYINDFNKYDRVFKVQMQAESRFRDKASDLSGIYVKNKNGVMVYYTDGVTEAENIQKEMFGMEKLKNIVYEEIVSV